MDNWASGIVLAKTGTGMLLIGPVLIEYPAIFLRMDRAAVQLRLDMALGGPGK